MPANDQPRSPLMNQNSIPPESPRRVRKTVDEVVADMVANQAAEGYHLTAEEIELLNAEIREKRASEIARHGGL